MKNKITFKHAWVQKAKADLNGQTVITLRGVRDSTLEPPAEVVLSLDGYAAEKLIRAIGTAEAKHKQRRAKREQRIQNAINDAWGLIENGIE